VVLQDRTNDYGVHFTGQRLKPISDPKLGVCKLAQVAAEAVMVSKDEEPFSSSPERDLLFSDYDLLGRGSRPQTCVIVSSAGAMLHSGLGDFIGKQNLFYPIKQMF